MSDIQAIVKNEVNDVVVVKTVATEGALHWRDVYFLQKIEQDSITLDFFTKIESANLHILSLSRATNRDS